MNPDTVRVINVIAGADSACCSDIQRLQQIKSDAMRRLACIVAETSAVVQVADQSWSYDRAFAALQSVIAWCDQQIDSLDTSAAYIVSDGPGCPY